MDEVLTLIDKHVDQEGLLKEIAQKYIIPKLEEAVASTENTFDDAALAGFKKIVGL